MRVEEGSLSPIKQRTQLRQETDTHPLQTTMTHHLRKKQNL